MLFEREMSGHDFLIFLIRGVLVVSVTYYFQSKLINSRAQNLQSQFIFQANPALFKILPTVSEQHGGFTVETIALCPC